MQMNSSAYSRTYIDFDSIGDGVDGLFQVYEQHLRKINPEDEELNYEFTHFVEFLDDLPNL